jgi:hypothetical protein
VPHFVFFDYEIKFVNFLFVQVSEISIPHFLTASIFSAQGGDIAVFHGNVRLLILLCVTSGICRSKSCMVKSPFYFFTLISYHLICCLFHLVLLHMSYALP